MNDSPTWVLTGPTDGSQTWILPEHPGRDLLHDNVGALATRLELSDVQQALLRHLIQSQQPVSRADLSQALPSEHAASNVLVSLKRLATRLGQCTPFPQLYPPTRPCLVVLCRGEDCKVSDGTWVPRSKTTPRYYAVLCEHLDQGQWHPGLFHSYHRRGALPTFPTTVGRAHDLGHVQQLLNQHHLLTLTGPAGIGKTHLAAAFVGQDRPEHALSSGGVWWVDCVGGRTTAELETRVAEHLGFATGEQAFTEMLANKGRLLLVLDNVDEALGETWEALLRWSSAAPSLRILCTSRRRSEQTTGAVYLVGELDFHAAVDLGVALGAPTVGAAEALVRRVGSYPLLLVLAVKQGSEAVLQPEPGSVLHEALERSWRLLSPPARAVVAQCSVFRGGFGLQAAQRLVDDTATPACLDEACRLNLLERIPGVDGAPRFQFLPVVRRFATASVPTITPLQDRHRRLFASWALRTERLMFHQQRLPHAELLQDAANLRAALELPGDEGVPELVLAQFRLTMRTSAVPAMHALLERGLSADPSHQTKGWLLLRKSWLHAQEIGGLSPARSAREEALELFEKVGDQVGQACACHLLGSLRTVPSPERVAYLERATGLAKTHQLTRLEATIAYSKANVLGADDPHVKGEWFLRSGELSLQFTDPFEQIHGAVRRSFGLAYVGRLDEALEVARVGLSVAASSPDRWQFANGLAALAATLLYGSAFEEAADVLQAAVSALEAMDLPYRTYNARYNLALAQLGCGRFLEATGTLHGVMAYWLTRRPTLVPRTHLLLCLAAYAMKDSAEGDVWWTHRVEARSAEEQAWELVGLVRRVARGEELVENAVEAICGASPDLSVQVYRNLVVRALHELRVVSEVKGQR